ncbi:hypothetical protein NKH18_07210 [Streptomyces sp. M10(2022)]
MSAGDNGSGRIDQNATAKDHAKIVQVGGDQFNVAGDYIAAPGPAPRALAAAEAADRANNNSDAVTTLPRPPRSPAGAAHPQAQPDALRMSRRRVLTALSFAGVAAAAGGGTWVLWPKEAQSFELPSGKTKIDAVMPVPPDNPQQVVSDYWLFAEDRYLRVKISADADAKYPYMRFWSPTELSQWGKTIGTVKGFRRESTPYWAFREGLISTGCSPRNSTSALRYPRKGNEDKLVPDPSPSPSPISHWDKVFKGFTRIDAVIPVLDDTDEVWVFSGDDYVRIKLESSGKVKDPPKKRGKISTGWKNSIGSPRVPHRNRRSDSGARKPNQYWVFSKMECMKINISDHIDSVLQGPKTLRTEPT